jgi:hypothetical protein
MRGAVAPTRGEASKRLGEDTCWERYKNALNDLAAKLGKKAGEE